MTITEREKTMKRNIKLENQMIKNICEYAKWAYLQKCNNYNNYSNFVQYIKQPIEDNMYDYSSNTEDKVMGEFSKYMRGFTILYQYYDLHARKQAKKDYYAVQRKLLKALDNIDYTAYLYEHLDEIEDTNMGKTIKLQVLKKMEHRNEYKSIK